MNLQKIQIIPKNSCKIGFTVMDGDSWVSDGRQVRAIEYFKKALELKPKFAMAQYGICKAYIQIADIDKSKNVDEELAKLNKLDFNLAKEI
ncbi:MAG TPA: tetratricopeptide repeat protein [Pyrinomonadaceae bacterium]|nr:tetratricopeptide repeat protein [Pyrinomonadaceae bacterium]